MQIDHRWMDWSIVWGEKWRRPEEASRQLYGGGELGGDKLAGRFPLQSPYRLPVTDHSSQRG
jgi:hypothetical protein